MLERLAPTGGPWQEYLRGDSPAEVAERLRGHESAGRPLGTAAFVQALEQSVGRPLRPQKRGRKPKRIRIPGTPYKTLDRQSSGGHDRGMARLASVMAPGMRGQTTHLG